MNEVKDNDPAVLCNLCKKWIHTASISIGETQYENLKKSPLPWHCRYSITVFPFSAVNSKDLRSLALFSSPTNINNHTSPTVKKVNKRNLEKVSQNKSNI